ncbi:retrovirus-related pol polyprotein from transposon TNT 1-94 [Tanacetum coccineum]|uniref:Retrovirus-related pol polyprotein from transposon TNT 1-94 n=1 Tax=Tanacetum coccineum TaxID=301880 RepID=A0ABQ5DDR9_9ASTR
MNDKMKDPECVTNKVKIALMIYRKENYLATFTPQKQLTPEQIFWSQDLIKMKAEALKKADRLKTLSKALTVTAKYTCNALSLQESTKQMMIERKNLLIAHDNLNSDCLSKEVFYVATNSELNVSRFTKMHDAHTIVEARCLELEAELSNLWTYYVEGLGHNLFSVGQFCDSDLEVAFRKHTCYVRDTDGVELNKGSHGSNLYTISIVDMMKSSPICLMSKASKNKSWLWHRRLNHLNFSTINDLARKDLVRGLPRLKFEKDHLYSACTQNLSKDFCFISHRD